MRPAKLTDEAIVALLREAVSSVTKVDPPDDTNIDPLLVVNPMGCPERRPQAEAEGAPSGAAIMGPRLPAAGPSRLGVSLVGDSCRP